MPIRRPECGFNPNLKSKIVNFRLPEFVPGNCPCVWPCTKQFDTVQRCRVTVSDSEHQSDQIRADGDPWSKKNIVIQENLAAQLCRGMKLALTENHTIPIGWIPIRVDVVPGDTTIDEDEQDVDLLYSSDRKIQIKQNSTLKVKREQLFINPGKSPGVSSSSEEGTDRLITQDHESRKCKVWRYKSCLLNQTTPEVKVVNPERRQTKRDMPPPYKSRLVPGLNGKGSNSKRILNKKRLVRHPGFGGNKAGFKQGVETYIYMDSFKADKFCGDWIYSESHHCIPEERIQISIIKTDTSSEENNQKKKKLTGKAEKKMVQKELCPGSVGEFPCFLRKKRSIDFSKDVQLEADKSSSDMAGDGDMHIINKIMIQPDPSCMCEWPCLPFFDRVNKCYNSKGKLVVDNTGRNKVTARSFRKTQRDPVVCINFVENDEIYCKIKK